jgi:hypothetical protein
MSGPRLCEVQAEMRPAVMRLGEGGDAQTVRAWASLRCPSGGHCDPSQRCTGFTPQNRQVISELQDRLFVAGFVRLEEIR